MVPQSIGVLIVEDYEPWRRYLSTTLQKQSEFQIIGEVSDGLEAVQVAEKLQPDFILLDIGLPTLNGIDAARRIRKVSSRSRILFVSENRSRDVAEAALRTGASGYVLKSEVASQLLGAMRMVLEGHQFFSPSLAGDEYSASMNYAAKYETSPHRHEVAFYPDDSSVVDGYVRFIESALEVGNVVIVVVTESHRASLVWRLEADGVDLAGAIERGGYISLDAADTLSRLTVNGLPDPSCCMKVIGNLLTEAEKGLKGKHARVVACGEFAPTMLSRGHTEGAIQLEHLWDEIARTRGIHTFCAYLRSGSTDKESRHIFERICAEHTAVHGL